MQDGEHRPSALRPGVGPSSGRATWTWTPWPGRPPSWSRIWPGGEERLSRAEAQATLRWECLWGDDPLLLSVPGMGPKVAPTVRAFMGDASQFSVAKEAQAYVGLNPSNWSSGLTNQPSRAITKEGPEELRLAFYQAANVARSLDPQLAGFYRRLMVERGHCHTKANCAVARKLVARTWATLTTGVPMSFATLRARPSPVATPRS